MLAFLQLFKSNKPFTFLFSGALVNFVFVICSIIDDFSNFSDRFYNIFVDQVESEEKNNESEKSCEVNEVPLPVVSADVNVVFHVVIIY